MENKNLTIAEEFKAFEGIIDTYMVDKDAKITGSEIVENELGTYVLIHYTISDKMLKTENLIYKTRTMEILLKRNKINEGLPISSYGEVVKC